MKIKKYTAGTMKEALLMVKEELGEDAMILKSRKLPTSLIPLGGGAKVEVTAAVDENSTVTPSQMPPISQKPINRVGKNQEYLALLKHTNRDGLETQENPQPITRNKITSKLTSSDITEPQKENKKEDSIQIMKIHDELSEMKTLLASILATGETRASGGFAGPWAILYKRLVDSEIREDLATDLLNKLKVNSPNLGKEINREFISTLASSFPVVGDETRRIQVFVGPTGTGKTTTIAKLAAYFSLEKKKKVSLITGDTYRIAAVEQLQAYADIVGINMEVVFQPSEIPAAIKSCADSDIILVDTAGRSQKNKEHMEELDHFLGALEPEARHLVMSATTKESDMRATIRRYHKLGINRLLFTKLDETMKLGNIYNVVNEYSIPVSYLTFGQSVPDDIETAQSALFVKKLLEGSSI
jgi:flagellar biosynthesis protein FlhF